LRRFSIAKAGVLTILVSALFPALCSSLSLPDLEKSLRTQKIISPSMRVSSTLQAGTLTFSIFPEKDTKETTGTLKIRAVLIAKTVMSTDKNVQKVEVQFHEKENTEHYTQILVRSVDIKAFSAGVTSEEELLNGLPVSTIGGGSTSEQAKSSDVSEQSSSAKAPEPDVAAGAKRDERAKLSARVNALKSKGVGVKPFLAQLEAVDELARAGESIPLSEKLEQLEYSIAEQEKILSERAKASAAAAAAAAPPKTTKMAARPAPPRATPTGAPLSRYSNLASTLASSSETAPLLRLFEGYAQHMKQKYNIDERLIPEQGPYWHERYNLAIMIRIYREKGYGDAIMPTWMECQQMAKAGDQAQTAYKMQTVAQALKLPDPIKNAGWYETQAEAYKRQFHARHEEEEHRSER
jgi:hypothetical protein